MLEALALKMKNTKKAILIQRQKEIQDSIKRLNEKIKDEPIYSFSGKLRSDNATKISSSNLDSLNTYLVREMLRSSNEVFNYYINNCAGENIEKMLNALEFQKYTPVSWTIKFQNHKGIPILIDNTSLDDTSNSIRLQLISELYLNDVIRFVDENQVLVLPFRIYRNGTHTDNRTVEYQIENGFLNIILPVIIKDSKQLVPYMSPDEYKQSEFERKRTRE